jgi:prepilin-type N-terminal cleavage/methylation domain-containing protein
MPTSATGTWNEAGTADVASLCQMQINARKQKGLSLLELLVVLLIIGTLVAYAIPAFVSEDIDSQISEEAHRLSTLLRLARDEAVLNAREYAVEFSEDGYSFHVLGPGDRWLPLEQEVVFRKRVMPAAIRLDRYRLRCVHCAGVHAVERRDDAV